MYLLSLHDFSTQFQIPNERTLIRFQVVCEQYKLLQSFHFAFYNLEARDQRGAGKFGRRCLSPLHLSRANQLLTDGVGSKLSCDGPWAEIRINPSGVGSSKKLGGYFGYAEKMGLARTVDSAAIWKKPAPFFTFSCNLSFRPNCILFAFVGVDITLITISSQAKGKQLVFLMIVNIGCCM